MSEAVLVERRGWVTTVILNRPYVRNAIDRPTAQALAEAFREFDVDDDAAVAVLVGAGPAFCAGVDLGAFSTERANRAAPDGDGPLGPTRLQLSKPVIAAVHGYAVAGGLELALWCDLRIADQTAVFGVFGRRGGVPMVDGGTMRLPRIVGQGRALDMILTGRPVDANEAHTIGLVNRVVPAGLARNAAEELAARIAEFPQQCLRHDRLATLENFGVPAEEAYRTEIEHGRVALSTEAAVGAARFRAGRWRHGQFGDHSEDALPPLTPHAAADAPTKAADRTATGSPSTEE